MLHGVTSPQTVPIQAGAVLSLNTKDLFRGSFSVSVGTPERRFDQRDRSSGHRYGL